ncbi:NAD-dependent epimerase/dehydratase family protein [Paenibacillus physcomitrellae]|uniref:UDP-2-acetamido-2,6-dideoxy-hexulose 4-reductase n=1 Tax=Paenibacillus physcomitrellae TaxID=1619311 RepID=A0ABQ1G5C2_9BACL|nr:SDR family NAD(P)-dependent oxidoreductase [Paenibacillus physcomitrellae]GGA35957.1 UDP-2-acetamido-2,6-dideoxy-hexulose 4-reductase [Paenibacillus physcomitrellae]
MAKETILITGAAGFTGRHACRHFAGQGYEVVGAVRSLEGLEAVPGVKYVVCDLKDYESVRKLVDKAQADHVLHLGGKNAVKQSWEQPIDYMETNVMGVFYLLEALRKSGKQSRVVVAHSRLRFQLTDHPVPNHPYGLSKSLGGMAALCWGQLFGQEVIIGEPANLVGPGPSTGICALLAKHIAAEEQTYTGRPFRLSSGLERRDFLDIRDAVLAYELLLKVGRSRVIYPICSGRERTLRETADSFSRLARVPVTIEEGDASPVPSSEEMQGPEELIKLGFKPTVSWEKSVQDIVAYWRSGLR